MDSYGHDLDAVIARAANSGISDIITIGIDIKSSKKALLLSQKYEMVHAAAGIHPHDVANISAKDLCWLESHIKQNSKDFVAYGEIGLDYVKQYADPKLQRDTFRNQLKIAKSCNKPIIIHDREAHSDILEILKEEGPFDYGGVMHCFSGDIHYAKKVLDLGFYISIPGIVTFKNATLLKEVSKQIPLEAMLIETDGPFLAPTPYRGKRNEPAYVLYTAQAIADLRNITLNEVADTTSQNGRNLFSI